MSRLATPDSNAHCGKVSVTFQGASTETTVCVSNPPPANAGFGNCPGSGCTSFANVTMETFDQAAVGTGCMNCHNATGAPTDFLWSLAVNAWPPPSPPAAVTEALGPGRAAREKSLNTLRELLLSKARGEAAPKE